ncbi:MAG: DUF3325 family protein [Acidobacteriota bacterium]
MFDDFTAIVCVLVAACFLLGAAMPRQWREIGLGREPARRGMLIGAWLLMAGAVSGFVASLGWEIGVAWFFLWFGLATVAATVVLSLRPRATVWIGSLAAATGLIGWIL